MIRIAPEVWGRLENAHPTGERLIAGIAVPDTTDRVLCALDSSNRRHFLIALLPNEEELRDAQSRGLEVMMRELVVPGRSQANYIDIECNDPLGYPAFDLIGGDIAEGLSNPVKHPAEIVSRVLAKWRRFWGQMPQQILSREEQLGLFGELWFLLFWLLPKSGPVSCFQWRGPWGARHDFEWSDRSVEVKTTTNTRGRIHKVHGFDQLGDPENGSLFLFGLRLREEPSAINTLPKLVQDCRRLITNDSDALGRFESSLFQAGYSPLHEEEYEKLHLRVIEEALFAVKDDFPRLLPTTFTGGIPRGIEHIDFEINLNTFDHLIVAQQPSGWS